MARKSHRTDEEKTKEQRGPIQYPYVVYASYNPGETYETMRWLILKFTTPQAARGHINALIGNDEWEFGKTTVLEYPSVITSRGVQITFRNQALLDEVMALDFDDQHMSSEVSYFKFRKTNERATPTDEDDDLPKAAKAARASRAEKREPREPKAPREKVDRSGMVSANDIAAELKVEGREVRAVLRAMKLEKPAGGWWFDKKTAEAIRDKVRAGLKAKKK